MQERSIPGMSYELIPGMLHCGIVSLDCHCGDCGERWYSADIPPVTRRTQWRTRWWTRWMCCLVVLLSVNAINKTTRPQDHKATTDGITSPCKGQCRARSLRGAWPCCGEHWCRHPSHHSRALRPYDGRSEPLACRRCVHGYTLP